MNTIVTQPAKNIFTWLVLPLCMVMVLACGNSGDGGGGKSPFSPQETTIEDLMGTYELTGFTITESGETYEDGMFQNWSGEVQITEDSYLTVILSFDTDSDPDIIRTKIFEIDNGQLRLGNSSCDEWYDMNRDGDRITLILDENDCLKDMSMVFEMRKTSSTVNALYNTQETLGNMSDSIQEGFEILTDKLDTP